MQNKVEDTSTATQDTIKTPQQLLVAVFLAFIIPIAVIILLINLAFGPSSTRSTASQSSEAIAERIQPVAKFKLAGTDDADAIVAEADDTDAVVADAVVADADDALTGEEIYTATCAMCHASGVAGAPVFGDEAAWGPLIDTGLDTMVKIAIEGQGAMPPRGGNNSLSDDDIVRTVIYMANASGGSFDEPAAADDATETSDAQEAEAAVEESAEETSQEEAVEETDAEEVAETATETAEIDLAAGKKLYDSICFTCHTTGVAGAPKIKDQASWDKYIATGMDAMVKNAINGVGAMPPRGGSSASDEEIHAAIEYMLSTL